VFEVSGGTLMVSNSKINGSTTAVQVVKGATATITGSKITTIMTGGTGTGILVGSSSGDDWTVTVQHDDLSGNNVGVQNNASRPVDATLNWWGSPNGPNGKGASRALGPVKFRPWLRAKKSLNLISGTTSYDGNTKTNIKALDAILGEWSSGRNYPVRTSNIRKGVGSNYALNAKTVKSKRQADTVSDDSQTTQNNGSSSMVRIT